MSQETRDRVLGALGAVLFVAYFAAGCVLIGYVSVTHYRHRLPSPWVLPLFALLFLFKIWMEKED